MWCPECGEAAQEFSVIGDGCMLSVDPRRLKHAHLDGTPLCPVMTMQGYQPALPTEKDPNEEDDDDGGEEA